MALQKSISITYEDEIGGLSKKMSGEILNFFIPNTIKKRKRRRDKLKRAVLKAKAVNALSGNDSVAPSIGLKKQISVTVYDEEENTVKEEVQENIPDGKRTVELINKEMQEAMKNRDIKAVRRLMAERASVQAAAVQEVEEDLPQCPICFDDDPVGMIQLKCGHVGHYDCLKQQIDSGYSGKRISFNYLKCSACRQDLEEEKGSAKLVKLLKPHFKLKKEITALSVKECVDNAYIPNFKTMLTSQKKNAEAAALAEVACYYCATCKKPFSAGRVDCMNDMGIDVSVVKCGECLWNSRPPSARKCTKHTGKWDPIYKCDHCCGVASYICGNDYYCEQCHTPPYPPGHKWKLAKPYEKRKVGQGQECRGYGKCTLGIKHPKNGTRHVGFIIGCTKCEGPAMKHQPVFAKDDKKPAVAPGGNMAIIKKDGGIEPPNHVKLKGSFYCWIGNVGCNEIYYRAGDYKGKPFFRRRGNPKDTIRCKYIFVASYVYSYVILTLK